MTAFYIVLRIDARDLLAAQTVAHNLTEHITDHDLCRPISIDIQPVEGK